MRKTLWLTALIALPLPLAFCGEAPVPKATAKPAPAAARPPDLGPLVEQLADPDFRKRDEAARRLRAEGARALPALRKALGHPDPEVRKRVHELVPQIERAVTLTPRRVTLRVNAKPLQAVFDEVAKQTGYKVQFGSSRAGQVYSFDFKDVTFWEAIDRISRAGGLVLQNSYDNQVRLQQQESRPPHVSYSGPFRFVPNLITETKSVDFGGGEDFRYGQQPDGLSLRFTIYSEPRLPLLNVGTPRVTAAYDSDRNSMVRTEAETEEGRLSRHYYTGFYRGGNRTLRMSAEVGLRRPSPRAGKMKVLRGVVPVTLLVEEKDVVVADKVLSAKGKKVQVGHTRFLFEDVSSPAKGQYQLKLSITHENRDDPNDYSWMNSLYQRISLQDAKGNRYNSFSSSWSGSGSNHVQLTLSYGQQGNAKIGPPAKFVFQQWTTLQHEVPFEFKDLPLP